MPLPRHEVLRLKPAEVRLVLRAFLAVSGFRLALWVLPFRRVVSLTPGATRSDPSSIVSTPRAAWAVRACARRVPGASCLTRALALRWLLARSGVASVLHFGWQKGADGQLQAHAWLMRDGKVVIGAEERIDSFHVFGA
jgi:hypothetical protein